MLKILFEVLFLAIYTLVGALYIFFAIDNFKDKKYFWFGCDIMIVIFEAACLAELVFER